MIPILPIVILVIVLIGTSLKPLIKVTTSIILAYRVGIYWLMGDNMPESEPTEPVVAAKA